MKSSRRFSSVIILVFFLSIVAGEIISLEGGDDEKCVYALYVKTGSVLAAGSDSKISLTLSDAAGKSVCIPNLKDWGLMGPKHNYFERGNLDLFSGRGPCIGTPICRLNITSNRKGFNEGWYCDNIQVVSTGPHIQCSQTIFNVDQWIGDSSHDRTVVIDGCATTTPASRGRKNGAPFIVSKHHDRRVSPQGLISLAASL